MTDIPFAIEQGFAGSVRYTSVRGGWHHWLPPGSGEIFPRFICVLRWSAIRIADSAGCLCGREAGSPQTHQYRQRKRPAQGPTRYVPRLQANTSSRVNRTGHYECIQPPPIRNIQPLICSENTASSTSFGMTTSSDRVNRAPAGRVTVKNPKKCCEERMLRYNERGKTALSLASDPCGCSSFWNECWPRVQLALWLVALPNQ